MNHLPENNWVDGPAFVLWLKERRPQSIADLSDSHQRALHRFRKRGARARIDVVDAICIEVNLHLTEIPEDLWTDPPGTIRTTIDRFRNAA